MKKVFTLLIALVIMTASMCFAEPAIDFSTYSDEELSMIKDQLEAEIASRSDSGMKPWKSYGAGALLPDPSEVLGRIVEEDQYPVNTPRIFSTTIIDISNEDFLAYAEALQSIGFEVTYRISDSLFRLERKADNAFITYSFTTDHALLQMGVRN